MRDIKTLELENNEFHINDNYKILLVNDPDFIDPLIYLVCRLDDDKNQTLGSRIRVDLIEELEVICSAIRTEKV